MSRKPENVFIQSVHRYMAADAPYRMKNHNEYVGGVADVWYSGNKSDLWVEYKFIKVPVRDTTVIDLISGRDPSISALQQEWLRSRYREGRKIAVVVGSSDGGVWFDGLSWDCTYSTAAFRSMLVSRKELAGIITRITTEIASGPQSAVPHRKSR